MEADCKLPEDIFFAALNTKLYETPSQWRLLMVDDPAFAPLGVTLEWLW